MRKIREVLRLKWSAQLSNRTIAKSCAIARSTVAECLERLSATNPGRLQGTVELYPALNTLGIDTLTRSLPVFDTDLNRMFHGSPHGETTQRIAYAVLEATKKARYRIDIHSSSADFEELPQVRVYYPTDAEKEGARRFGLTAIMERRPGPVFSTTLMNSWKVWPGENYLLTVGHAGNIQLNHCQEVFKSLVTFLGRTGILEGVTLDEGDHGVFYFTRGHEARVYAEQAGMFVSDSRVGRWVNKGQELGYIYDSFNGNVHTKVEAPFTGLLTGIRRQVGHPQRESGGQGCGPHGPGLRLARGAGAHVSRGPVSRHHSQRSGRPDLAP